MTVTAPTNVDSTIYLSGFILSASAAPAAALRATIAGPSVGGTLGTSIATIGVQVPAAAFAMISRDWTTHPLKCVPGQNAVVIIPALGSGVVCDATLFWFYGAP